MPRIHGPDCTLNVEILGEGAPVTLLAHGITGSTDELMPVAERMTGTRVLLDFRGHGKSDSPEETAGYDHPAMRRDLEAAARGYRATRVVALSMGAGAALNLVADRPDAFERLVLIAPASIDGPNAGVRDLFLEMALRLETQTLDEVLAWSLEGSADLIAQRPHWRELIRRRVDRMNATGIPRALRAYVDGRAPVDDASRLRHVPAPALILANHDDAIHDAGVAHRLADLLPNARLKIWPEAMGMFGDPAMLAKLIEEFFA